MKIQIENVSSNLDIVIALNGIQRIALRSKSINEFAKDAKRYIATSLHEVEKKLKAGKGSNHAWVSDFEGKRFLFITE